MAGYCAAESHPLGEPFVRSWGSHGGRNSAVVGRRPAGAVSQVHTGTVHFLLRLTSYSLPLWHCRAWLGACRCTESGPRHTQSSAGLQSAAGVERVSSGQGGEEQERARGLCMAAGGSLCARGRAEAVSLLCCWSVSQALAGGEQAPALFCWR